MSHSLAVGCGLATFPREAEAHGSGGSYPTASLPARTVVCVGSWSRSGPQIPNPSHRQLGTGPSGCRCQDIAGQLMFSVVRQ